MPRKIDISHKTIVFVAIFILGLWITYLILDLLLLIFAALILTSALSPLINKLVKMKLPRVVAIIITYIIILGVVGAMIATLVPTLIEQSTRLISTLPPLLIDKFNLTSLDTSLVQSELADLTKNIYSIALGFLSNLLTVILLLVLTFYLLLEQEKLKIRAATLFPNKEARVRRIISQIEDKLGRWLRGQLFLSLLVGILSYIGLIALNIPYALPLALVAGVLEVVPVIGPIISALPAIGMALTIEPILALGVAAMYFVIQQLESHIIVPQVMKKAVGLNPLVVILAIAVGSRLLGITGALLAVPITVVIHIIVVDILVEKSA